jgi:hypothetical protein
MSIYKVVFTAAVLAAAIPSVGIAQQGPPAMPPGAMQARDAAKTASFNDLNPDHRAKVQAIVDKFNSGSLSMTDATSQIDGILSPDESKAVLGEQEKFRDAMRQQFANQNGGGGQYQGHGGMGMRQRQAPDAGRFLLMMSASPDALRSSGRPPQ